MHAFKAVCASIVLMSNGIQPIAAADGLSAEEVVRLRHAATDAPGHEAGLALGLIYESGRGVRQDYVEAVKWYRLCADTAYDNCQLHLGRMYSEGTGVPQDLVIAHMWLNLAASHGGTVSKTLRDQIAERMTPAQIAEAQKLARDWKPNK